MNHVLSYMYRFEAKVGLYLYPEVDNKKEEVLYLNSGTSYENNIKKRDDIKVIKLGLQLPCVYNDYKDYQSIMRKAEEILTKKLKIILSNR